jgi:ketosteroid isomerase-like protein
MIENPPANMPRVMPMTPAVAPSFTARYPEAAAIFDNLHSMHDVISDILANPSVRRDKKREAILEAGRRYRDDTSYVMTRSEWLDMAKSMGIENMGGPVSGFLGDFPAPTVERGAKMDHTDHAAMGHDMPAPSAPAPAHVHPAASGDSAAVAKVVNDYHAALSSGDSLKAISLLTPDAVILESGGIETVAEYRSHHLASDIAFAKAVKSERSPVIVRVAGNTAWTSSTSVTQGTFNGRAVNTSGAESMVLVKDGGTWRIRSIHWSSRNRRST